MSSPPSESISSSSSSSSSSPSKARSATLILTLVVIIAIVITQVKFEPASASSFALASKQVAPADSSSGAAAAPKSKFVESLMKQNIQLRQKLAMKKLSLDDGGAAGAADDDSPVAARNEILLEHVPDAVVAHASSPKRATPASSAAEDTRPTAGLSAASSISASFAQVYKELSNETATSNFVRTATATATHGALLIKARMLSGEHSKNGGGLETLLKRGTEVGVRKRECNEKMKSGFYWNEKDQKCQHLEGFFSPLHPFEASVEELSCSPGSLYEQPHNDETAAKGGENDNNKKNKSPLRWITYGFKDFDQPSKTLDHFNVDTGPLLRATATDKKLQSILLKNYSRFMFFTSWQFRQWLPWIPRPVVSALSLPFSELQAQYSFRAYHDSALENLYVIRNGCVMPFGGMSGFHPTQFEKPSAKLDERSKFHTRDAGVWGGFFKKLTVLPRPAAYYDERPVIFAPRLAYSHPNIHHTFARFVSLVGILDLPAFSRNAHEPELERKQQQQQPDQRSSSSEFAPGSHTEHWNQQQGLKPLIVFVFSRMTRKKLNADRVRVSPWAFFIRSLDLPVAVVNARNDAEEFMSDVFSLSRHSPRSSASGNKKFHDRSPFCFQRAVIYQNCHPSSKGNCDWKDPHGDLEEYSFGAFSKLTPPKRFMLNRYLRLLHNCLPIGFANKNGTKQISLAAGSAAAESSHASSIIPIIAPKTTSPLPQVMINVRSSARTLAHLPLIADEIRRGLEGFASDVLFREPWRGSRAQYVEDMRHSDIFFANHGGAFAEVVLLRPRPVVVEVQSKVFACREAGCWFGMSVEHTLGAHWIVQVSQENVCCAVANKTFHVPANFIVDILRDAVCKWYNMNPGSATRGMTEKARVYCKLFAPRVEGGSKYRSSQVWFLNGGAGASFSTDANAVLRTLRDDFALEIEGRMSALRFIERLRSVNSKLPGKEKLQAPGALRSEAPMLFETLLQRFIDTSIGVAGMRNGGGTEPQRKMEQVVCLEGVGNGKVCLYSAK